MTPAQEAVLAVLKEHGPLPDHALVPLVQHVYGERMSSSGIRTRRRELTDMRKVKATKETVTTASGRKATLWKAGR